MEQNIYLDVYFGFNFLMDFFVLFITRIIIKNNKSVARISFAAGMGAIYATFALVFNSRGIVAMFVTYLVVAELMSLSAFGKTTLNSSIKRLCVLYCVTFSANGVINAVYYGTEIGKGILDRANTVTFGKLSLGLILCIVILVSTIVISVADKVRKDIKVSRNIYQVKIYEGGITICVNALCDTGNSLVDPMTKKPVSVIEKSTMKPFDLEQLKYLFVPYNSVGKQHGLMQAFVAEQLEVNGKIIQNALVGIYDGKLSQNNKYEMILHPDIIEENINCKELVKTNKIKGDGKLNDY